MIVLYFRQKAVDAFVHQKEVVLFDVISSVSHAFTSLVRHSLEQVQKVGNNYKPSVDYK